MAVMAWIKIKFLEWKINRAETRLAEIEWKRLIIRRNVVPIISIKTRGVWHPCSRRNVA